MRAKVFISDDYFVYFEYPTNSITNFVKELVKEYGDNVKFQFVDSKIKWIKQKGEKNEK